MWSEAWARQGWILSPRWDLFCFIGTPFLALAVILPLGHVLPPDRLALYLLAWFATGHHLPGFVRIFADPKLFARYPGRFLLAPPIVFALALWFAQRNLHGLILATVLWDLWHSFMQHYGFMRIYAAKSGDLSPVRSWLDLAVSLTWFVAIALWSPAYSLSLLRPIVQTTGLVISPHVLIALRWILAAATLGVTAVYVALTLRAWRRGEPVSPAKLVLLLSTILVIAVAWWVIADLVLGYAIWAVFHDIQYFAIVWVNNHRLAARTDPPRRFLAFLFRARLPWIALYLLLIFAYGSVGLVQDSLAAGTLRIVLGAYITTSTLMHYYFDGFIWKVREPATREALGVATVAAPAGALVQVRPHGERLLLHGAALLLPAAAMLCLEPTSRSREHTYRALTTIYPGWGDVQFKLGDELYAAGKREQAAAAYHEGLAQQPDSPLAHENLATIYLELGRKDLARHHLRAAARLAPRDAELSAKLAQLGGGPESDACCREPRGGVGRAHAP